MRKACLTAALILISLLSSSAQSEKPVSAPADVVLELSVEGNRNHFHLGELVPIKFSYRTESPGKYILVAQSSTLSGGRPLEISCSPSAERAAMLLASKHEAYLVFGRMLTGPCGGVGGGVFGGCFDCDGEYKLTADSLSFGVIPLNTYVRFRTPGTYTCEASSAVITTAPRDEKIRPALLVKSKPIVLTISNDQAWAHSAAIAYGNAYEASCRGDDVAEHNFLQCSDIAHRITYLDTADSLAVEVKWFDGKNHGWDNGFWNAIQQSSQPQEALRLMASRVQESDFEVSTSILEWLASTELKIEMPDAFQSGTPAIYHEQAVDKLRKYLRLVGSSLSKKDFKALPDTLKTYRTFAEQKYCEPQPLISAEEEDQVLSAVSAIGNVGTRPRTE